MIKFLFTNEFDGSTVTASATATGFSTSNVLDRKPHNVWRSSDDTDEWLKFDLGSAKEIDMFTIHKCNLGISATLKLYGHSSDLGSSASTWAASATFNSNNTLDFDENVGSLFLPSSETLRWWFLEISDPSNPDTYVEIGSVFGGLSESPSVNFNENFEELVTDSSRSYRTEGQHKYSVVKNKIKTFNITFSDVDTADRDTLRGYFNQVGKTEPFVVSLDSSGEPVEYTRLVTFENDLSFSGQENDRYTTSFNLSEIK